MWGRRGSNTQDTVSCIACNATLQREDAREYDKYGDRWDRKGKEFEHLCKACYRDLCHQPRDELEGLLMELDAGSHSRDQFLSTYCAIVEDRYGPLEEQ